MFNKVNFDPLLNKLEFAESGFFNKSANFSGLEAGTRVGQLAYVTASEGTAWLPSTLGGSYYPKGWYVWDGTDWVSDRNTTAAQLESIKNN